jgi:hypothetical protein
MLSMENIRDIRRQLGLTQIEMAERLGLHQSTISRFESGELPVDKRTALAAKALLAQSSSIAPTELPKSEVA